MVAIKNAKRETQTQDRIRLEKAPHGDGVFLVVEMPHLNFERKVDIPTRRINDEDFSDKLKKVAEKVDHWAECFSWTKASEVEGMELDRVEQFFMNSCRNHISDIFGKRRRSASKPRKRKKPVKTEPRYTAQKTIITANGTVYKDYVFEPVR